MNEFDDDRPPRNPLYDLHDELRRIEKHVGEIAREATPLNEQDMFVLRTHLETLVAESQRILQTARSIKYAAWLVAAASILHLMK